MMRFRKGSTVEVLSKREVPSGSWFRAEIISGNGHYYNVKYEHCSPDGDQATEKVQRKAIRPCAPPIVGSRSWIHGDIVEGFEKSSWKPAKVIKVLDGGNYSVISLIGSSEELMLHKSNIRLQQSWKRNRWVLFNKELEILNEGNLEISSEVGKFNHRKLQRCAEVKNRKGDGQFYIKNDQHADEPYQISLRGSRKRSRFCSPKVEASTRAEAGKKIGGKKEGKRQRLLVADSSKLPEKVDACASSRIIHDGIYMGASLNNRTTGFPESGLNWGNPNEDVYFFLGSLEHSDSDSLSSSAGSCSPNSSPYRSYDHPKSNATHDMDTGDEASSVSGRKPFEPTREGGTAEIHQLELNAYRSIIVALYASGPLSWEREALLTNLRLMLHITNDEYLFELRHLNNYQKGSGFA